MIALRDWLARVSDNAVVVATKPFFCCSCNNTSFSSSQWSSE